MSPAYLPTLPESTKYSPTPFAAFSESAMETKTSSKKKTSQNVAVIGAGAAGLVSARELRREGHQVVVFERNSRAGGVWVYDTAVESDPLSINPSRTIVHSSLYDSLRTNLPREVMGFRDYPFVAKHGDNRDPRRFPSHTEVLHYLDDFMTEFRITELIRFETEVVHVELIEQGKWAVRSRHTKHTNVDLQEVYNAIVICNGHYSTPRVAEIPGIDVWPGKQMHSHNYRVPDPFQNKVVVLIGGSISANDIGRDIARVAKEVHVASRSNINKIPTKQPGYNNLWLHSMIKSAHEDGSIIFHDDNSVLVDVIIHCTGYTYDFPFLDSTNIVTVDDNRVGPLYQHVFPPQFAPWISFIGLPFKTIPFILFELQSKWVAGTLSGKISHPSPKEMISDINVFYSKLEEDGVPKRYTHDMFHCLFEYYDWLAAQCQFPATEEWRKLMVAAVVMNFVARSETFRDEWVDQDLILQAHQDFIQYIP